MDALEELMSDPNGAWEHLRETLTVKPVEAMPCDAPKPKGVLRFVCVSDTHNRAGDMVHPVPPGDVLLHAGDFTRDGSVAEAATFNDWLGSLPHRHKVVIAGNHDVILDRESYNHAKPASEVITNATYLEDSATTIHGLVIYGTPWTPIYHVTAFNLPRGEALRERWAKIPRHVDILMSHGPPLGYGDLTWRQERAGCVDLLRVIKKHTKPKYHICGHIHEGYGITTDGHTTFVNASTCDRWYNPVNPPIVFDVPIPPHTQDEKELEGKESDTIL